MLQMNLLPKYRQCFCVYFCSLTISGIWTEIVTLVPEQLWSSISDFLSEEGKNTAPLCLLFELHLPENVSFWAFPSAKLNIELLSVLGYNLSLLHNNKPRSKRSSQVLFTKFSTSLLDFWVHCRIALPGHFGVTMKLVLADEGKWLMSLLGPSLSCEPVQSTLLLYVGDHQCFRQQTLCHIGSGASLQSSLRIPLDPLFTSPAWMHAQLLLGKATNV